MSSLLDLFIDSERKYPSHPALILQDQRWSYAELAERAALLATTIRAVAPSKNPLLGLFADRSLTAYTGLLGAFAARRGFVPLLPDYPPARCLEIIERAELDLIIAGPESLERIQAVLRALNRPMTIILPETEALVLSPAKVETHRLVFRDDLPAPPATLNRPETSPGELAYLLFTSGSTGHPKGVAVAHGQVCSYIRHVADAFEIRPGDRTSQTFKMAFDLSLHDLFSTWSRGATLYPLSGAARMAPGRFIRDNQLTHWFCVPTMAMTMDRFRQLAPGAFPSLRMSLFCGEPLPADLVERWAEAAPNSDIHNIYGPTEATIAVTSYRWEGRKKAGTLRNGVVPLGDPFPGTKTLIVNDDDQPVGVDEPGELLLGGPQITSGYWKDPERTAESFVHLPATDELRWYRTGDIVERDSQGTLHILGRRDHQIQLAGHRVELGEVDHALRRACGHGLAISVAWPYGPDDLGGIVGFVAAEGPVDETQILQKCRDLLPSYMLPSKIIALRSLPRNNSGKLDRKALQQMLDQNEGRS